MASNAAGSMTPAAPPSVHTPPAPRLGFHDSWEPFSPRKSARLCSQRTADRTPSPRASHHPQHLHHHRHQQQRQQPPPPHPASPRAAKKADAQNDAAMVSPVLSPRKKPHPVAGSFRQASGTLTAEGTANAAAVLGLNKDKAKTAQRAPTASISCATGMLPTPSKTPQKPPNEKTAANIRSFARNLFAPDEEAAPSPRKRRPKKYSGVTMESFTAVEPEDFLEIFTDSQDRVPVKDQSAENPFYGDVAVPEPRKRQGKRKLVSIPGERPQSIEEASRRQDGMVYVFRGKKFYRKFSENDDAQLDEQDTYGAGVEPELTRPLTRAYVKPRLLFPRHQVDEADQDDEAVTDVEDMYLTDDVPEPQTPKKKADSAPVKTPEAPRFAPASPPATKRTTRSANRLAHEATPMKKRSSGRRSPFDTWPRTKENRVSSAPKRHGESLAPTTTKRSRA